MGSGYAKRRTILAIIATDRTFERTSQAGQTVWRGKCLHCRRWMTIGLDGEPISDATIEHIVPRTHGGTESLDNLGLACGRCNRGKGIRLDVRRADDPKLREVIDTLLRRRRERWRDGLV